MRAVGAILLRELSSYFATPLAYVFIVIFLVLNGVFTFYLGGFYERGQADLVPFFGFHPWLYLFLVSAIAMRLWAEDRRSGTLELLLTLPVRLREAVIAKFLAAWIVVGLALSLTFPVWLTVNFLGDPDNGVIVASYLGSWLMAGAFLAIGSCMSAISSNQVVAFILTASVCFLFTVSGFPMVLDMARAWLPTVLIEAIAATSVLTHFQDIARGVLDLADLIYFLVMIAGWLIATAIVIDLRRTG